MARRKSFIQTDDYQWLRECGDHYEIYQVEYVGYLEEKRWFAGGGTLYLNDFEPDEIEFEVQSFGYDGVADVKRIYGEHWERIVAECVFECNWADYDLESFDTLEEALEFVNKLMEREG